MDTTRTCGIPKCLARLERAGPKSRKLGTERTSEMEHGFYGGSDGKEYACNAGDPALILGLGRSPRERNGNPLQYSCLENSMDRGYNLGCCKKSDTAE